MMPADIYPEHILRPGDEGYPRRMRMVEKAPAQLYAAGGADLDAPVAVAVVGTRQATRYGVGVIEQFVSDLASLVGPHNLLVISGLAAGCDIAAHRAALEAGASTAAVLAHGLDTVYPAQHRGFAQAMRTSPQGILVSEYPHNSRIHHGSFLARNRLVAAMADCVVVAESGFKGGSLNTAHHMRDLGRPVYAVPGRWGDPRSEGCNALVASGKARLLMSARQLAQDMLWDTAGSPRQLLLPIASAYTPEQQRVIDVLTRAGGDVALEALCAATALGSIDHVRMLMSELVIEGDVLDLPGPAYRLAPK